MALSLSLNVFSQNLWYAGAGYLNSAYRFVSYDGAAVTTNSNGFYVGAGYETSVRGIENFYLDVQLLYSYQGDKYGDVTENIHMLSIPFRAKYKAHITDQFGIFGYGGPVASFGLAANEKQGNFSYSLYGDDGMLNRFDVKLGLGAGIEFSRKIVFRVGYDWGLFNILTVDDVKMHINIFHVDVIYNL